MAEVSQVYVSGALTNNGRRELYERIGDLLWRFGYMPYVPHLHTDPEKNPDVNPKEVYDVDMEKVDGSVLVVAYVGYPSLGTGAELERACSKGIPIILLYQKGEVVSRLVKGMPMVIGQLEYEDEENAIYLLKEALERITSK